MFKYSMWNATIISDVLLDLGNRAVKDKLVVAKMMVDRTGTLANSFFIKNEMIQVFPNDVNLYKAYLTSHGEIEKDFHEEAFVLVA